MTDDQAPPKRAFTLRTREDISAEIYGMPPYKGPGLKHGPGGTGRSGSCDPDCRKCVLEAELRTAHVPGRIEGVAPDPRGAEDAGAAYRSPVERCLERVDGDSGGWCVLRPGHEGRHRGVPSSKPLPEHRLDRGRVR